MQTFLLPVGVQKCGAVFLVAIYVFFVTSYRDNISITFLNLCI